MPNDTRHVLMSDEVTGTAERTVQKPAIGVCVAAFAVRKLGMRTDGAPVRGDNPRPPGSHGY